MESIAKSVQRIIKKYSGDSFHWKAGTWVKHPRHGLVQITGGSYLVRGRISNYFYWRKVTKFGLGKTEFHGYGWM